MLVNFQIDPSHSAPQHVKEWIRYQVLKQIDDFRLAVLQSMDVDLTGEAMEMLKIAFLCEFGRPKFNAFGKVVSYDNVILTFDVPKETIEAEYNNFIDDLRLLNPLSYYGARWSNGTASGTVGPARNMTVPPQGNGDYFIDTLTHGNTTVNPYVWTWSMLPSSFYDLNNLMGEFQFNKQTKRWSLPMANTQLSAWIFDGTLQRNIMIGKRFLATAIMEGTRTAGYQLAQSFKSKIFQMYKWYFSFVNTEVYPTTKSGFAAVDPINPNLNLDGAKWPMIKVTSGGIIFSALNGLNFVTTYDSTYQVNTAQAGLNAFLVKSKAISSTTKIPDPTFTPIVSALPGIRATFNSPRFGVINILSVSGFSTIINNEYYYIRTEDISTINPATAMNGKLTGGIGYFVNETMIQGPKIAKGLYRVRSGILYADGSRNFSVDYVEYPDALLDILDEVVKYQDSIDSLEKDMMEGKFIPTTANFTYKSKTYSSIPCSSFFEFGMSTLLRHPIEGFPMSAQYYKNEMLWMSFVKVWQAEAEIAKLLEERRVRNEQAFQDAYHRFLRSEAQAKGTESLAEYELKLKTGYFYLENGISYWRPFTSLEIAIMDELKAQGEANVKIAEQNKIIEAQNKAALDSVNAQVVAENNAKIEMATKLAEQQVLAEMKAKADALVIPTMGQLIKRARELQMNAPETLEKWIQEHPFLALNTDKAAQVEKLMNDVKKLEEKVATTLVVDTINEARMTTALKELFKVV